ncbi:MAG: preprotein translocase subunit SecG [Bacteroidetes bacterium]|jgi:preprotein translocase subunit SecG|nr:preprotein translocase subunit SecG [Bacteroidota bacterium]
MNTALSILIILVCFLLVIVVLVQNSKGGGIQSQFGAATQIMGVKRGTEFIEKATWGLAIALIVLSIAMAPKSGAASGNSEDNKAITKDRAGNAVSNVPATQPAQNNGANVPAKQP